MRDLLILSAAFAATAGAVEALVVRRVQSALGVVACIHGVALIAVLAGVPGIGASATLVFWIGALSLWFGVKSHLESSILLRIVCFLRGRPATRDEILERYEREYGRAARLEELVRAGFVRKTSDGVEPTRKGRLAARIAVYLR